MNVIEIKNQTDTYVEIAREVGVQGKIRYVVMHQMTSVYSADAFNEVSGGLAAGLEMRLEKFNIHGSQLVKYGLAAGASVSRYWSFGFVIEK